MIHTTPRCIGDAPEKRKGSSLQADAVPCKHILDALEAERVGDQAALLRHLALAYEAAARAHHQKALHAGAPKLAPFTGRLAGDDARA